MSSSGIASCLPEGGTLLVVPPFMRPDLASLGVHVLQACAREAGFTVGVFYANLAFAARIGEDAYRLLTDPDEFALGERLFAGAAFGAPALDSPEPARGGEALAGPIGFPELERVEREAGPWADEVARAIAEKGYGVVGCSSLFDQTAASVALLDRVKRLTPGVRTLIGGANCEGEMAEGILSLGAKIDHVFSGESETAFVELLRALGDGGRLPGPVVEGENRRNLDDLPPPDFREFFQQREWLLPPTPGENPLLWIPYECSRGCPWGGNRRCRFCGFLGGRGRYRWKSPEKIVSDLATILARSPTRAIALTDNAIPTRELPELAGRLERELAPLDIFCAVRADASLREAMALARSGVTRVQPGVESLSTSLLARMGKGITVRHVVAFLRYAMASGMVVLYNILWGFPGDTVREYEETFDLMARLHHLPPPKALRRLLITRFSPYFERPEEHGIRALDPLGGYEKFLPAGADARKIARQFLGEFESAAFTHAGIMPRLRAAFETWRSRWQASPFRRAGEIPRLAVLGESRDRFRLVDTRGLPETEAEPILDRRQAEVALVARPVEETNEARWAVGQGVAVVRDGWLVPLATARPEMLLHFEDEYAARGRAAPVLGAEGTGREPSSRGSPDEFPPSC